jgi:hypothetical protein
MRRRWSRITGAGEPPATAGADRGTAGAERGPGVGFLSLAMEVLDHHFSRRNR